MADTELYRRLWREVQKHEGVLDKNASDFIARFIPQLRSEGWDISPASETLLNDYLTGIQSSIKDGIDAAIKTVAKEYPSMQSAAVAKLAEEAFKRKWPDGINLSERLWKFDKTTRDGMTKVLQDGVKQGKAVSSVVMELQRSIERNAAGQGFKIVTTQQDDWVKRLFTAGQNLIHDPDAKIAWLKAVGDVEEHIIGLAETGTKAAAERVLDQIKKAVDQGSEELMENAVKWWGYDKQLYNLKRIVRTEMATAQHRAVIDSTVKDPDIIGYQWRLSSSHPTADICDYYASVDMGLGKGVWSKDSVPDAKAHPHCMCLLIPRVTPIKRKGNASYAEFIENVSPEQQAQLLPKWAQALRDNGVSMEDIVRPDGMWSVSRRDMIAKLGQERFDELISVEAA